MNNINDLAKHAAHLWKYLDHLAETDPTQYKNFIAEQARHAGLSQARPFIHPFLPKKQALPSGSDRQEYASCHVGITSSAIRLHIQEETH